MRWRLGLAPNGQPTQSCQLKFQTPRESHYIVCWKVADSDFMQSRTRRHCNAVSLDCFVKRLLAGVGWVYMHVCDYKPFLRPVRKHILLCRSCSPLRWEDEYQHFKMSNSQFDKFMVTHYHEWPEPTPLSRRGRKDTSPVFWKKEGF